jgi:hypothetical protein
MTYNPEFIDFIDSEEKLFKYYGFKSKNFNVWNLRSKLYGNPNLAFYVEHYIEKINKNEVDWDSLASNLALTHILIKNIDNIVFYDDDDEAYMVSTDYPKKYSVSSQSICANRNPLVMEIIKNKIKFFGRNGMQVLSANPNAIEILKKHPKKVYRSIHKLASGQKPLTTLYNSTQLYKNYTTFTKTIHNFTTILYKNIYKAQQNLCTTIHKPLKKNLHF